MLATELMGTVENWMNGFTLKIAQYETEVLLVCKREVVQHAEITVGRHVIAS